MITKIVRGGITHTVSDKKVTAVKHQQHEEDKDKNKVQPVSAEKTRNAQSR